MRDFFPIHQYADGQFGGGIGAFRDLYMATRVPERSWFAVKASVLTKDTVEFTVYGMRCNYKGGLGDKEYSYKVKIRPEDQAEMDELIMERAAFLGEARLKAEEERARLLRITEYANEILAGMDYPQSIST